MVNACSIQAMWLIANGQDSLVIMGNFSLNSTLVGLIEHMQRIALVKDKVDALLNMRPIDRLERQD